VRTTVDIDDDVLLAVKELAKRQRRPAGKVLSELARQALTGAGRGERRRAAHHGFRPLPHRGPAVSNELIDRLREDEPE
jgi:hypothetical protein